MKRIVPNLIAAGAVVSLLAACSGTEDVRVTFCKNISAAVVGAAGDVDWRDNENTFKRPEYATAGLTFAAGGKMHETACYFEYDAVEDTANHISDPFSAYATLPFAMTVDGRMLSDAELVGLRNAEQRRIGRAVIDTLDRKASELADRIRAELTR